MSGINAAIDTSIIIGFILQDRNHYDIEKIWNTCPNHMLWEAIRAEDVRIIQQKEIPCFVKQTPEVYILPEPLSALYQNKEPSCQLVSSENFIINFSEYIQTEPLYLINKDFSWMIVLTTENTPSGEQLCALLNGSKSRDGTPVPNSKYTGVG